MAIGRALAQLVNQKARELVSQRNIDRKLAAELLEQRQAQLSGYQQWKARIDQSPAPDSSDSPDSRKAFPPEPVIPSLEEALNLVEQEAIRQVWMEAFALTIQNKEAVRQYRSEQVQMHRNPIALREALMSNPWAFAHQVAVLAPTVRSPGDPRLDRTSDEALWQSIERALCPEELKELSKEGTHFFEHPPEVRKARADAMHEAAVRGLESPEWQAWCLASQELVQRALFLSVPELEKFKQDRVVPAFNALNLGCRMCIECSACFGILDGLAKDSMYCGERCGNAARRRNQRQQKKERPQAELEQRIELLAQELQDHAKACQAFPRCSTESQCPQGSRLVRNLSAARRDLEEFQKAHGGDMFSLGTRITHTEAFECSQQSVSSQSGSRPAE
jgi:hypothetical protein